MSADDWDRIEKDHREAVEEFLIRAVGVPETVWAKEPAPGKWSPGQIAEHVALSYEVAGAELDGGERMGFLVSWWQRFLLRRIVLPRVLSTGRIPGGGRAAREIRPGERPAPRTESVARVSDAARRFQEKALSLRENARVTSPYFGSLVGRDVLRFLAVHTRHHASQIPRPDAASADHLSSSAR